MADIHDELGTLPVERDVSYRMRDPITREWVIVYVSPDYADWMRKAQRTRRGMISARVRRGDLLGALDIYGHAERLDAVIRWHAQGRRPIRAALERAWTSAEWPGSYAYLPLWRAVAAEEPELTEELPPGDPLNVYRGQPSLDDQVGISWTLDPKEAAWFALTLPRIGGRPEGAVLWGRIRRRRVLAYLTERGEAEVIVDPGDVEMGEPHVLRRTGRDGSPQG